MTCMSCKNTEKYRPHDTHVIPKTSAKRDPYDTLVMVRGPTAPKTSREMVGIGHALPIGMNNAADTRRIQVLFTINGVEEVSSTHDASKLEEVKDMARQLRDAGYTLRLRREPAKDAAAEKARQARAEAEHKAAMLAMVGHEDDDGSAADYCREQGWI